MKRLSRYVMVAGSVGACALLPLGGCGKSASDACDEVQACGGDGGGSEIDTGTVSPGDDATSSADTGTADSSNWQCCGDGAVKTGEDGSSDSAFEDAGPVCGADASYCGTGEGCVDTNHSVTNCGSCNHACAPPSANGAAVCNGGSCGVTCNSGYEACAGQCVSDDDLQNCGGCNNVCPSPTADGHATCMDGGCGIVCNSSYHLCSGECLANADPPSASDPCVISEQYAVFVSPTGSDSAGGTRAAPFQTIAHAMTVASTKKLRVYACASAGTYVTPLTVNSAMDGVQVYGGLSCAGGTWSFSGMSAKVAPTSPGVALAITGLTAGVSFTNFEFDAQNASTAGASSIAVFVSSSTVTFAGATLAAGNGQGGPNAGTFSNWSGTAPGGANASGAAGADGGVNDCDDGHTSSTGGNGAPQSGFATSGSSVPVVGTSNGGASTGGITGATAGSVGANASAVANTGTGAPSSGTVTATGWVTTNGTNGANGNPGQGGGGGGSNGGLPFGGGGGGAGGCGGGGGVGGQTGGSSIALLSIASTLTLTNCTLRSGNGGNGGSGGPGQGGQAGGTFGGGETTGGTGGIGSGGGGGGGGAAGLSASLYWSGSTAPSINGSSVSSASTLTGFTFGTAGNVGGAGIGATANGTGAPGGSGTPGAAAPPPAAVVQAP